MRILKNNLLGLGAVLTGIVGHHYGSGVLDYRRELKESREQAIKEAVEKENMEIINAKLDNINNNTVSLNAKLEKLTDKLVSEADLLNVQNKIEYGNKHCRTVKDILDKGPENLSLEYYQTLYRASVECEKATREANDAVKDLIDSLSKSGIFSNFNLNSFNEYLNSLNLLELSAIYHILVLTLICLLLINIISAILGNEIINYFKLEKRFPIITAFLKLRLKFQKYYLILSFSLIFIICIASVIIDLLVLY